MSTSKNTFLNTNQSYTKPILGASPCFSIFKQKQHSSQPARAGPCSRRARGHPHPSHVGAGLGIGPPDSLVSPTPPGLEPAPSRRDRRAEQSLSPPGRPGGMIEVATGRSPGPSRSPPGAAGPAPPAWPVTGAGPRVRVQVRRLDRIRRHRRPRASLSGRRRGPGDRVSSSSANPIPIISYYII